MTIYAEELATSARRRAIRHELEASGTVTRYWVYPADRPKAEKILFIHGYRGNHHGLEAIAGALPEFEIYIPDLPGFGESTQFAGEHSVENYSNWIGDFIKAAKLRKPHLLGHSFGSILAAKHAATADDISSLILENPVAAPALSGPRAALTVLVRGFFWLSEKLPHGFGIWLLKSWPMVRGMSIVMTKSRNSELRRWVHLQHDQNFSDFASRRVAIEGYNASVSHSVGEFAGQFRVPTTMIIGLKDDITSPKQQHELAAKISAPCTLHELPSGHLTHYEDANLVARCIRYHIELYTSVPDAK